MTSALPPSIWWERPPSFGTSGAAPLPRGRRQAGQRQSVLGTEDGHCSRGTEHRAHRPRATRATSATTERQDGGPDAKQRATDPF